MHPFCSISSTTTAPHSPHSMPNLDSSTYQWNLACSYQERLSALGDRLEIISSSLHPDRYWYSNILVAIPSVPNASLSPLDMSFNAWMQLGLADLWIEEVSRHAGCANGQCTPLNKASCVCTFQKRRAGGSPGVIIYIWWTDIGAV